MCEKKSLSLLLLCVLFLLLFALTPLRAAASSESEESDLLEAAEEYLALDEIEETLSELLAQDRHQNSYRRDFKNQIYTHFSPFINSYTNRITAASPAAADSRR